MLLEECQISRSANNLDEIDSENNQIVEQILNSTTNLRQRALIFCQWRSSIDLIAGYIDKGVFGNGINYLRLDGSIQPNERQNVVDQFNRDSSIDLMILSTHVKFFFFKYIL